jgi:hypothetical protein
MTVLEEVDAIIADKVFVVCMPNASHSDGRKGDAYIGNDLQFSTLDLTQAHAFNKFDADRYAEHWRGWYRGFAGGVTIEIRRARGEAAECRKP